MAYSRQSSRRSITFIAFIVSAFIPVIYNGCSPAPFEARDISSVNTNTGSGEEGSSATPGNENSEEPPATAPPTTPPVEPPVEPPVIPPAPPVDPPVPPPVPPVTPPTTPDMSFYFGNANISNAGTPAFMIIGHLQSSMYSCDGGQSWRGYQTANTRDRCWEGVAGGVEIECDHTTTSAKGVAWGPQGFMAAFGWGAPGNVRITSDGNNWQQLRDTGVGSQARLAGVAYGNGRYVLTEPYRPLVSSDGGMSFQEGNRIQSEAFNQRQTIFFASSGLYASFSQSGDRSDIMISDDGLDYVQAQRPANCGNGAVAQSPSRIILRSSTNLCTSDDGGRTWVDRGSPPTVRSNIIYDGQYFIAYNEGLQTYSSDGINWQSRPLFQNGQMANRLQIRKVSYHPVIGKYIGIYQSSPRFYEHVQFYHSDDGYNWTQVDKAAGLAPVAPHPIREIAIGFIPNCQ